MSMGALRKGINRLSVCQQRAGLRALCWATLVTGSVLLCACQADAERFTQESTALSSEPSSVSETQDLRVLTPDWGIAATMIEMGHPPIASGDLRVYDQWVGDPALPNGITDLGIRYQPNAELVAQMNIDLVLDNFFYAHNRPMYRETPIDSVTFMGSEANATWQDFAKPTRNLGELLAAPDAAERYLQRSRQQIARAGTGFTTRYPQVKSMAVVQFTDSNHLSMYGHNSLFNAALDEMGLRLSVVGEGSKWGFTPITLGDLAQLDTDTCLVVIEPMSPMLRAELADNLIWQRLGYGTSRCMTRLPPTWIYGGPASLVTFAQRLQAATLKGNQPLLTAKTASTPTHNAALHVDTAPNKAAQATSTGAAL